MKSIGAGFTNGIDNHAVAPELRAVRVGQGLELCDCFDAERRTRDSAYSPLVKILDVFIIDQECLSFGSRACGRERLRCSLARIRRYAGDQLHAWRELDELLKISAVQGKLPHLL